ncbi:MAG: 1,4-dihydroxy-2-naphthoate polyprenyltransferase [Myxococcales bacterium]|nr:1,4-dihydroxy-2-naphthoate polyprenyltransferase [Myxococcales bacterium]
MSTAIAQRPSGLAAWFLAVRPRTLVAGVVPVAVGSAVALRDGHFQPLVALAALAGALLLQIGTNLANDYYDFKRGADTADRLGPPRATQQGWLAPGAVLAAGLGCFGAALLVGLYLVSVGGPAILVLGLASIAAGLAYTAGPFPLAYHGLGDLFVLAFFGLVAVGGTYFVQAHALSPLALWASLPVGLLGVALLAVNNTRDEKTDAAAGKRTLVVRLGRAFGRAEWLGCVVASSLVPVGLFAAGLAGAWVLLPLASTPLAVAPGRLVFRAEGALLNQALAGTARLQLVFGLLFAVGLSR